MPYTYITIVPVFTITINFEKLDNTKNKAVREKTILSATGVA
jgi:hypothetical protein